MSLRSKTLVLFTLFALLLVSCGGQATPTKSTVSVPGLGSPATPGQTAATPAPTRKDYPAPAGKTPNATGYPAPAASEALLKDRCTRCHDLARVMSAKETADEWKATVERMIGKGAQLSAAEKDALIKYLAETYKK